MWNAVWNFCALWTVALVVIMDGMSGNQYIGKANISGLLDIGIG